MFRFIHLPQLDRFFAKPDFPLLNADTQTPEHFPPVRQRPFFQAHFVAEKRAQEFLTPKSLSFLKTHPSLGRKFPMPCIVCRQVFKSHLGTRPRVAGHAVRGTLEVAFPLNENARHGNCLCLSFLARLDLVGGDCAAPVDEVDLLAHFE